MRVWFCNFSGENGRIDGQGAPWWDKYKKGLFKASRPFLIELMYTNRLQISNVTLINSPSWHLHPIYCRFVEILLRAWCPFLHIEWFLIKFASSRNVVIQWLTILAPVQVPNTDGINPGYIIFSLAVGCSLLLPPLSPIFNGFLDDETKIHSQ